MFVLTVCFVFKQVGQNVKAASSIGATQHSQINRSELIDWPVLQLEHSPTWVTSLDATLDMVQVGDSFAPCALPLAPRCLLLAPCSLLPWSADPFP